MAKRPYTGFDGNATGRRAGTEKLIQLLAYISGNALWNNGSWGVRAKRGKADPSIHGTGRAFDISWRKMPNGKGSGNYADAVKVMDLLVEHADLLGIEAVFDYYPAPHGRGWKCDRDAWQVYDKKAFAGAPGGDWIHVEVSPAVADDPGHFQKAFESIFSGEAKPAPAPAPAPAEAPVVAPAESKPSSGPAFSRTVKRGSRGDLVRAVQQALADRGYKNSSGAKPIVVDGRFGANTEQRVKDFQRDLPCPPVDGVVGPKTWAALFGG